MDDVLRAEWQDDEGQPLHPVAYSVERVRPGRCCRAPSATRRRSPPCSRSSASTRAQVAAALAALPEIAHASEYDWSARQAEARRWRDCFSLDEEDADAARAFGCLLELPGRNDAQPRLRHRSRMARRPDRPEDRRARRRRGGAASSGERESREPTAAGRRREGGPPPRAQRQYEERVSARARNLDLGAALARWQPKLDTDAVKLLGSLVLLHYGKAAAWAHRLCVEQPTTTNKQGKTTVRYPRGAEAETEAPRRGDRAR